MAFQQLWLFYILFCHFIIFLASLQICHKIQKRFLLLLQKISIISKRFLILFLGLENFITKSVYDLLFKAVEIIKYSILPFSQFFRCLSRNIFFRDKLFWYFLQNPQNFAIELSRVLSLLDSVYTPTQTLVERSRIVPFSDPLPWRLLSSVNISRALNNWAFVLNDVTRPQIVSTVLRWPISLDGTRYNT